MITPNTPVKYFLYARKSSETEDRQVQSIEDQQKRLREIASERGLVIVAEFQEAKSARKPGARPVFASMLASIEAGRADGILCWQLNRLSRNPIESGQLSWMLQSGLLKSIITSDREHRPEDNVLILSVETGMANQFILELSRNVKRGIQGKLDRGELPGKAPVGYVNDAVRKVVIPDPDRFETIKRLWKMMLLGTYTVPQLHKKLNDEWGFTTIRRARQGGKPLALSALYRMFSSGFYAGMIRVNARDYPGAHTPMITVGEFASVQHILGKTNRPRPSKHIFTYSRLFSCDECGCFVTAEHRTKLVKTTGKIANYVYYHCTLRKRALHCSQRTWLREDQLTERLAALFAPYSVPKSFTDWTLRLLKESTPEDIEYKCRERDQNISDIEALKHQRERLTQMRYRDMITDEDFLSHHNEVTNRMAHLELLRRECEADKGGLDVLEEAFERVADLSQRFPKGTMEQRRNFIAWLGLNRRIRDNNPLFGAVQWAKPIIEKRNGWVREYRRFELMKKADLPTDKDAFRRLFPIWLSVVDEVRNRLISGDKHVNENAGSNADPGPIVGLYPQTIGSHGPISVQSDQENVLPSQEAA